MGSFRPLADVWILARPKVKYYGAYPNGFLERALPLLGVNIERDRVLHLCGGRVKEYPNKRLVANAVTVDADASLQPDYVVDLEQPLPLDRPTVPVTDAWPAVLIDPPYTEGDHQKYDASAAVSLPSANHLLRVGLQLVVPGGRVGVLHYVWPQPPKTARSIAAVGVLMGFNNRIRVFSVFERMGGAS